MMSHHLDLGSRVASLGVVLGACLASGPIRVAAAPAVVEFNIRVPVVLENVGAGGNPFVACSLLDRDGRSLAYKDSAVTGKPDVNVSIVTTALVILSVDSTKVAPDLSYRCDVVAVMKGPALASIEGKITGEQRNQALKTGTLDVNTSQLRYTSPAPAGLVDVTFVFQTKVQIVNAPGDLVRMQVECRILDRTGRVPANAAAGVAVDLSRGVPQGGPGGRRHEAGVYATVSGSLFFGGRTRETLDRYSCSVVKFVRQNGSDFVPADIGRTRITLGIIDQHLIDGRAIVLGRRGQVVIANVPVMSFAFGGQ